MQFLNNPLAALVLLLVMGGIVVLQQRVAAVGNRLYAQRSEEATFGNRLFNVFFDLPRNGNGGWTCAFMDSTPDAGKKERKIPLHPERTLTVFSGVSMVSEMPLPSLPVRCFPDWYISLPV